MWVRGQWQVCLLWELLELLGCSSVKLNHVVISFSTLGIQELLLVTGRLTQTS